MAISGELRFRANLAATAGRERAIHFYSRNLKDTGEREAAVEYIDSLIRKYGPVVEGYPSWHPFTSDPEADDSQIHEPHTEPQGFVRLDHTIYFRDAFVTAPYGDAKRVIKSATDKKNEYIEAEEITEVTLYSETATPVLVTCDGIEKATDGTISKRYALGRMLSDEVPAWKLAQVGESWEDMRRYHMGAPCGSRSSLFVNEDTGKALREVWNLLNHHELFGPPRS